MNENLHLVAHVGGRALLFDTRRVDCVIDMAAVTPTPGASGAVIGLAAIRSRIATVVDTARLLGLSVEGAPRAARRAVVTMVEGHTYALAVDALDDVVNYAVSPPPSGVRLEDGWAAVSGIAESGGETLPVVDVEMLIDQLLAA